MAKNLVLGPILAPLDQIWAPKNFVHGFYFYYMLDIVASYQGKLITKLENIAKNLVLGNQFFFSKIWLGQSLDIMVSYHHVQYQKNLLIQS